jgi:Ankyrin repeats (3 copies)
VQIVPSIASALQHQDLVIAIGCDMRGPFAFISPFTFATVRVGLLSREACGAPTKPNGRIPARSITWPYYSNRVRMCSDGASSEGAGLGHADIGHHDVGHAGANEAGATSELPLSPESILETPRDGDSMLQQEGDLPHEIMSEDDGADGRLQGPTPAPTQAGVSTVGLGEAEAKFMEACYVSNLTVIEESLDGGIDVHTRDVNKRTAIHFCAGSGLTKIVRRLAELGADVNAQDMLGLTPLHMATGYKKPDTVSALVDLGADPHLQCYGGELSVELGERLLRSTPKKRLLVNNPDYEKLTTIVELLDSVTEEEEDDEEDEVGDILDSEPVEEEVKDGAKLTIRRKPKSVAPSLTEHSAEATVKAEESAPSDPNGTVRRKQPANSPGSPERPTESGQDASFTIRRRGGGQ